MNKYHGQFGQDKFLNENIFKGKRNGFFVDIGANDGITISNTLFFERELDWKGICFEPLKEAFQNLSANRKSVNINGCASSRDGKDSFISVTGYAEMLSGLKSKYDSRHFERLNKEVQKYGGAIEEIEIECYDVNRVLKENNIRDIDFISIDTEGSEFDILNAIDFSYFNITAITVENNYKDNKLKTFLHSKNFKHIKTLKSDEVFLNHNYQPM